MKAFIVAGFTPRAIITGVILGLIVAGVVVATGRNPFTRTTPTE